MQFDDVGFFWEPFKYQAQRVTKSDPRPRTLPPIPDTGWVAKTHFPDLSSAKAISLDTETCDPDLLEKGPGPRRGAYIVGVSLATDDGFKGYYPVAHSMGGNLEKEPVYRWLSDQLSRRNQPKVGANLLYDLDFLSHEGIKVSGPFYDVLYADPLIYEYERRYSLDSVAERRIGKKKEGSQLYRWCADAYGGAEDDEQRANIWRSPVQLVGPYAEQDALLPLEIIKAQTPLLRSMGVAKIFEMECRLIPLLLQLRQRGVPIDLARCEEVDAELTSKIDILQKQVGIDVYAGDQIRILCDAEGIDYPLTELGNPSFTKDWLIAHDHPKLRGVSELRKLYKMRDAFVRNALLESHINGRVHCEFHPLRTDDYGTVSGRYSSTHPNLQQIPIRDDYWGPLIRSCFVPEFGRAWMKKDMSQIEFRLGVHYAKGVGAQVVQEAYRSDPATDFYMLASRLTGLIRQSAKSLSLGSLYGMGLDKYCRVVGGDRATAKKTFYQFHERLRFMKDTYNYYSDEAKAYGFVTTIGGRVCHLDIGYEHKALNRKLQGSCADWIKQAMLLAYEGGIFDELEIYLTVHDELDLGALPRPAAIEAHSELHRIMCNAYPLSIPVLTGCDVGSSWGKLNEFAPDQLRIEDLSQNLRR